MSTTGTPGGAHVDLALEAVVIAVSDVDAAKAFYEGLGWRLDADLGGGDFRIVQCNPPGSQCSIQFGTGLTSAAPGSAVNLLVVADVEAARDDLVARGVDARGLPRLDRWLRPLHRERPGRGSRPRAPHLRVVLGVQ